MTIRPRNRRRVWRLFALAIILGLGNAVRADSQVGALGDVSKMEVTGTEAISPQAILDALEADVTTQIASSPSAPLDAFLATLQRRVLGGYLNGGYDEATVTAAVSASGKHITFNINEGRRYRAGPVEITGAVLADRKAIESALTSPIEREPAPVEIDTSAGTLFLPTWQSPTDASDTLWEVNDTACLTDTELDACRKQVVASLLNQGLFWAKVSIEPEPRADQTVRLKIHIASEGPKGTIAAIQLNGLKINKRQEVLDYAGLKVGMPVDLGLLRAVRKKFWDSGRFFHHDIHVRWFGSIPGKVSLELDFREHPDAPPLSTPIPVDSPQGIMLRFGQSLEQSIEGGDCINATVNYGRNHVKLVIQPNRGEIIHWTRDAAASTIASTQFASAQVSLGASSTGKTTVTASTRADAVGDFIRHTIVGIAKEPVDLSMIALPGRFILSSAIAAHRMETNERQTFVTKFDFVPDPEDTIHPIQMNSNVGFRGENFDEEPPIVIERSIAPVVMLDLVSPRFTDRNGPVITTLKHGTLTLSSASCSLRVDAASGRLIDLS